MPKLEFWFDFASTYSYLSAMRIEALAEAADVEVDWVPFLLGPIFKAQGWTSSPFNLYPAKGRYMVRDIERLASERGLPPFRMPSDFPQQSVAAARVLLAIQEIDSVLARRFAKSVFVRQFQDGLAITDVTDLAPSIGALGLDFASISKRIGEVDLKDRLKQTTADAARHGVFGAPSFRTADGELFWGDDRLPQSVAHARQL